MISNTEKSSQILKEEIQRLEEQGISGHILEELMEFRRENDTGDAAEERCIRPQIPFFGKEVLEMAIAALLAGENVLLCGGKATGKNHTVCKFIGNASLIKHSLDGFSS